MQSGLVPLSLVLKVDRLQAHNYYNYVCTTLFFDCSFCYWLVISCKLSGVKTKHSDCVSL